MTDRIVAALAKAREKIACDYAGNELWSGAESAAALAVIEGLQATIETDIFETYCDVGSPDDCDHCLLLSLMHAFADVVLGDKA